MEHPLFLIYNIAQLASPVQGIFRGTESMQLDIKENAGILIQNDIILETGNSEELFQEYSNSASCLDAGKKAVIPGFTDSHTHLVYGGNRANEFALRIEGKSYPEIAAMGGGISSTVKNTREASFQELKESALRRLDIALQLGTTTMEVKSGYGLSAGAELKILKIIQELQAEHPIELIPTFLGAHSIPKGTSKKEYLKELEEMMPAVSEIAHFCDVFCETGYFDAEESREILEMGLAHGMLPKIHTNQFTDIGGLELALEIGAVSADHLEVLPEEKIHLFAESETIATVLPGVSHHLGIPYSPARKLIDVGAIVALASDFNPGSCPTVSMPLLMNFASVHMHLKMEETLCCATRNGAKALNLNHIGCIAPGFQADLLLLNSDNYQNLSYHFGMPQINAVIKKGNVVWENRPSAFH